jgi:transcriptional regulator with XRE-family HTH domain
MNGAKIRRLRKAAGLTQEDLAQAIEVSRQAVSAWERGSKRPSQRRLKRLRVVLCHLEDLFIP